MATFVIGDIHGCWKAFETLIRRIPIRDEDTIVTLGDYVDRGPNVRAVLSWLIDRQQRRTLHALIGNHEEVMLQAFDDESVFNDWLGFGGRETLASYGLPPAFASMRALPTDHAAFLENRLVDYVELADFVCVHGNLERHVTLAQQSSQVMRWRKFYGDGPQHISGKTILCGHTAQRSGEPLVTDHTICIDTCAYGGHWLTAFEVEAERYWQANESGAFVEWRGDLRA